MVTEGRFEVHLISTQVLVDYMRHRGETVRSLAAEVDKETARQSRKTGEPATSSRSVIGHLRSGKRKTCAPPTARAIEKCLNAPPGSLFVPSVSHVSRPVRTAA